MASLHQVLSADARAWRDCAAFFLPGDTVILADAGVGLLAGEGFVERFRSMAQDTDIYVLRADAGARGLLVTLQGPGVHSLGDQEWVRMACSHDRVLSWK